MSQFAEIDRDDFRNLLNEIAGAYMPFGKYGPKELLGTFFWREGFEGAIPPC